MQRIAQIYLGNIELRTLDQILYHLTFLTLLMAVTLASFVLMAMAISLMAMALTLMAMALASLLATAGTVIPATAATPALTRLAWHI